MSPIILPYAGEDAGYPPSGSATTQEGQPQWGTYLDLKTEVAPWCQLSLTDGNHLRLTMINDMACSWVQNYCNKPVAPLARTEISSGWENCALMLDYCPVISVQLVQEVWGTSGIHTLSEQTSEYQGFEDCYQIDPRRGIIYRTFQGLWPRPFFPGLRNLTIEYTAGYQSIPSDLKMATLELCKFWWENTQQATQAIRLGTTSEYDASTPNLWAGVPNRVTALLQPYRQITMA